MSSPSSHSWEPWQLTAYILGELEADEIQRLAESIASDPALQREVAELAATLKDVRAVYRQEKIAHSDPCPLDEHAMSALLASQTQEATTASLISPAERAPLHRVVPSLGVSRNLWLSLAALLLIGISIGVLWRNPLEPAATQREVAHLEATQKFSKEMREGSALSSRAKASAQPEHLARSNSRTMPAESDESQTTVASVLDDSGSIGANGTAATQFGALEGRSSLYIKPNAVPHPGTQPSASSMAPEALGGYGALSYGAGGAVSDPGGTGGIAGYGMGGGASGAPGMGMSAGMSTAGGGAGYGYAEGEVDGTAAPFGSGGPAMLGGMMGGTPPGGGPAGAFAQGVPVDHYAAGGAVDFARPDASGTSAAHDKQIRSRYWREGSTGDADWAYGGRAYAAGDQFALTPENDFAEVRTAPLSTFSIDVDTASFAKARQYLLEHRQMPPAAAVRIEEFINYFDYDYAGPKDDTPFASALAVAECPWQPGHKLVRIALQAKKIDLSQRPKANLVFLLDVSGSMDEPNKLPLVKETMRLLTYQLGENDRVAMVVYAGAAGCVLESTRGDKQDQILSAIERLSAGGSTNGGEGIKLAYSLARDHFIPGGINRVILCTDGDFNVGVTGTSELVDLVAQNAKSNVFLTVLGYGMGNTNDAMMEEISNRGNGVYGFVDSRAEAQRQMVKQLTGNLMTVAKDVKIQVEFNPATVRSYRLIGYENRRLAAEDFNNDKKDAGEIGAGHRVTALYEIVPTTAGPDDAKPVEPLKYQPAAIDVAETDSRELLTVNLRYKQPEGDKSSLLSFSLEDSHVAYTDADRDFRWAAAVAEFGMLLRGSQYKGTSSWDSVSRRARMAAGSEPDAARSDCIEMIRIATQNSTSRTSSGPGMPGEGDGQKRDRE